MPVSFKKIAQLTTLNPNYLLVLAVFNGAILMNFHKLILQNPWLLLVIIGFVVISIIDFKYWWATVANALISVYLLINQFPRIGNHSTLLLGFSIALLVLILLKFIHWKTKLSPDYLSYLFRIITVTVYFFTGFHKLNTDFFNPCVSCVDEINEHIVFRFTNSDFEPPVFWSHFFQYATVFVEMLLPFGLLWHRTRKQTALLLLFFHCYLSFSLYADFSAMALFLVLGCVQDFKQHSSNTIVTKAIKVYLFLIILAVLSKHFMVYPHADNHKINLFQGVLFNIGLCILVFIYFKNYTARKYIYQAKYAFYSLPIVLLISFWTLKTYIGLGNMGNLTMFSNLVTEKSMSNHLLIDTKKTKLFDFEEDNVEIIQLHNSHIRENFEGYKVPLVEFKFMVSQWKNRNKPIPCKLIYKGKILVIKDLKHSEFNAAKWWYKYLCFRKIQTHGPNGCRW